MADGDYGEHLPSGDEDEPDEVEPLEDDEEPDEHVVGAEDGGVVNADGSTPGRYELNGVTVLFNDVQNGVGGESLSSPNKNPKLEIVVNAAPCIAQALKLRHEARTKI